MRLTLLIPLLSVGLITGSDGLAQAQTQASTQVASDLPAAEPSPAAPPTLAPCASAQEVFFTDCPLTWQGITLYGTYDLGVGWVSHGLPVSGSNYEGESLVNRNGNH